MSKTELVPLLFAILVLDLIAFTSILPLLPSILKFYDKSSKETDSLLPTSQHLLRPIKAFLGVPSYERYDGVFLGGILGSIFSFLQFICNPMFGALSDVFGRKIILLFAMFGTSSSYFIWMKSSTFGCFFMARIIGGISKGSVTIITAIMSDITDKEKRGQGMAVVGIAFSVAFVVGPLCGAYFAANVTPNTLQNPFVSPALFSLFLQILAIIITIVWLPETMLRTENSLGQRMRAAFDLISPWQLFQFNRGSSKNGSNQVCEKVLLINFLFLVFFSGLEFTLTFLTYQRFAFGNRQQGMLFLYIGIIMILIQGGYVRKLQKGDIQRAATFGIFLMIPSMLTIAFGRSALLLYVSLALFAFSAATVVPCLTTIYSQEINKTEIGEKLGIFRSAGALARAIGPIVVCFVYWKFGSTCCYLLGACCFCIPLLLCYFMSHTCIKNA